MRSQDCNHDEWCHSGSAVKPPLYLSHCLNVFLLAIAMSFRNLSEFLSGPGWAREVIKVVSKLRPVKKAYCSGNRKVLSSIHIWNV